MIMCINKKMIWAYQSMKKGMYDNDYYFYEDGSILHFYDRSVSKFNIEEQVQPSSIPDNTKKLILEQCQIECAADVVDKIKTILFK